MARNTGAGNRPLEPGRLKWPRRPWPGRRQGRVAGPVCGAPRSIGIW